MNPLINDMTNFIFLEDSPELSDIIFIPGSGYGALSLTAADLWHKGLAPIILPSGKHSILEQKFAGTMDGIMPSASKSSVSANLMSLQSTSSKFTTEADYHKAILIDQGVPESAILLENQAAYTYENAIYSRKITDELGLHVQKAIICCQAFHARRCRLYYELLFPETKFYICPTVTQGISKDNWYKDDSKIDRVLGEIERCGSQFHQILRGLK